MKKQRLKITGFTLVELMVTIAIVAILLGIGIPSFREMIMDNRISMRTNNFVDIIQFARSEAVRVGKVVDVQAVSTNSDWGKGITVQQGAGVLRMMEAFQSGVTLNSGGANGIQFRPSGLTSLAGPETFDLCDSRTGETGRQIELLPTGLIRVTTLVCS